MIESEEVMERTQKHWTANSPHAGNNHRPSQKKTWQDEADEQPTLKGPCDGAEAGRLLRLYGAAAVDVICLRVAKCGGVTR